ncbi:TfoX/Sxy family protein [Candidatus Leptofilum sp.]|uniref:TfoX/Sxy family protein n=1 Tax=Candidatus Leptofilum sp. TaxID=3241576 RepID=UPI003B59A6D3
MANSELESLLNLGPKSTTWLANIGVHTQQELSEMGIMSAYCLLKAQGYPVSLNLLYALYGALHDMPWNKVPPEVKQELKADVEGFRFG